MNLPCGVSMSPNVCSLSQTLIITQFAYRRLTVVIVVSGSEYSTSLARDVDSLPKYYSTGSSVAVTANRVSYCFDLHGPSMAVDTACSSSAVALHQALLALKSGDCDAALVSGANLMLNPDMFIHMSKLGFLSPSGACHSFDIASDGYARGEGVLAIVLKILPKALQDRDPIRSVIRASSLNQDGRTQGITLPSSEAQQRNMEQAYWKSQLAPGSVQYIEAYK